MSMMINPARFGLGGAPSEWQTITDGVFTGFSNNWQNNTIRTFISRGSLPAGAIKVRVTFGASSSTGLRIAKAYVGPSRGMVFDDTPTQLLFGGVANYDIASANGTILSDELTFTYNGTKDLCISFYVPSDASGAGLNTMGSRGGNAFMGSNWNGGDLANSTGGTWSRITTSIQGIRKVEIYTGGTWKSVLSSVSDYSTNWDNYTLRSLVSLDQLPRTRNTVRFGLLCRANEVFVGNSAEGSSPFNFLTTPIRVTFGGANATPAEDFVPHLSDDFDYTQLDISKPLLMSYHTATTRIAARNSPPTGQSSRYKSGNQVSDTGAWQTGSSSWSSFLGPHFIDEKY
jgi:hypothetical protein